jgi:DNA recombination protein RmuC
MDAILLTIGGTTVTLGEAAASAAVLAATFLLICLVVVYRMSGTSQQSATMAAARAAELETRIASLLQAQSETSGRLQSMSDLLGSGQSELGRALSERLDGLTHRLNTSMGEATKNTHDNLKMLHERLAVLDAAQQHITALAGEVTTLSGILANKQTRGAFGQGQMEAIISDHLPPRAFAFQFTLKSGARPDCIVHLPHDAPPLVIDAKFPLEAHTALKSATNSEALKAARQQFRNDLLKHIRDIAEKYLIPGETHETAFMFVPSESIFAEIYDGFDDIVQRAHRSRVVIVSPSLLLLAIQIIQTLQRGAQVRELAHVIQDEVMRLMDDVRRLDERAENLATHFRATQKDVQQVLVSTKKILAGGEKVKSVNLDQAEIDPVLPIGQDNKPML